ncbi:hypothetical protein [Candidatus Harpocratesius sp.]
MVDSLVTRTLNVDFLYFDLLFLILWIGYMIYKKYWIPIIWGILGWVIYLYVDYYLWYIVMGVREYDGNIAPTLFFQWFCFSAGFAQFSYVAVMFEKRSWREVLFWTLFFYIGWSATGILSQIIPWNDTILRVSRNMNKDKQRILFTIMTIFNIILALFLKVFKKIKWEDFFYLFAAGTLVEMNLELSLAVSGIRLEQGSWSFELFIVNTLIEFNMGIVLMYLLWGLIFKGHSRIFDPMLKWRDRKKIKTNFNYIYYLCTNSHGKTKMKEVKGKKRKLTTFISHLLYNAKGYSKIYPHEQIQEEMKYIKERYSIDWCK